MAAIVSAASFVASVDLASDLTTQSGRTCCGRGHCLDKGVLYSYLNYSCYNVSSE